MDDLIPIKELQRTEHVGRVRRRTRLWRGLAWIGLSLLAIGGLVWLLQSRSTSSPTQPPTVKTAVPVLAGTAQKGDVAIVLNGLGAITPLATVMVKTQIAGQIVQIAFQEGQTVHQGDLLAQIDPRPYQLALKQVQGTLGRDQALLKNAQVDLARYAALAKQNSIATRQVDTQAALVRQYEARVKTDEAMVEAARLNLTYCRIIAPMTGRVGLRQVDQGNYVQTSDPNGIVVITQMQPISVVFSLPEDNLPAIMKRLKSGITLPVAAYDRSQRAKLAEGKLLTVDNQVDVNTGTVRMRALFDNADEGLFPNQFVNAHLEVDVLEDATVIPMAAVQRGALRTFVYLVNADNTVTPRPVKLGPSQGERVAVQTGLAPGDRVIVDGADRLGDGTTVELRNDGSAAPGGAANPAPNGHTQPERRKASH